MNTSIEFKVSKLEYELKELEVILKALRESGLTTVSVDVQVREKQRELKALLTNK